MRGLGILAAGAVVLSLAASGPAGATTVTVETKPPISADLSLSPKALPKHVAASARLSLELRAETVTAGGTPIPPLREIVLRLDRNIVLDFKGYPSCRADLDRYDIDAIGSLCESAIVGEGSAGFESAGLRRRPVELDKKTLVLNGGRRGSIRTLFVVSQVDFPQFTMAVFPVRIRPVDDGRFGREATLSISSTLTEAVGSLTSLNLEIDRKFIRDDRRASVVSAKCPDGKLVLGVDTEFSGGSVASHELVKPCTGKGD